MALPEAYPRGLENSGKRPIKAARSALGGAVSGAVKPRLADLAKQFSELSDDDRDTLIRMLVKDDEMIT